MHIMFVLTLAIAGQVQATIVEFHQDGLIKKGDEYDKVYIYENATVGITGGKVGRLYANDSSRVNLFGGEIQDFFASDSSTIYVYGGSIDWVLGLNNASVASLFGGNMPGEVGLSVSNKINIYGYGFHWQRAGGGQRAEYCQVIGLMERHLQYI
jgi:hypothetical protein